MYDYIHELSKEQMIELEKNQKDCADMPPATYRATFKLKKLQELIDNIKNVPGVKENDELIHNICIVFVRDDFNSNHLAYDGCINYSNLKKHIAKNNNKEYTQLIPIITGCHAKLNGTTKDYESFEFIKIGGKIPYARSGGEGTGLIPPPPPPGNDNI